MGWVVNVTTRPLYPGKDIVPIVKETGWATGPVWTDMEKRKSHALTGIPPPTVQPAASL
jgi:hypothetical protein